MDFSVRRDNRALLCRIPFNNGEECTYFTEAGLQPLSPLHAFHFSSVTGNQYLLLWRARAGQVPGPVTKRQSPLSRSWQLSEKTDKLGEPQRSAQTPRKPALPFWGLEEMLISQPHEPEGCLCPSQGLVSTTQSDTFTTQSCVLNGPVFIQTLLSQTLAEYDSNSFGPLKSHPFLWGHSLLFQHGSPCLHSRVSIVPLLSDDGWLAGPGYIGGGWAGRRQERILGTLMSLKHAGF